MDEPCSALDPIATRRIEELMLELKQNYTIAIVTHNMQQAMRVADTTAFFSVDISKGGRTGYLVEMGPTKRDLRESPREAHRGIHPGRVQLSCARPDPHSSPGSDSRCWLPSPARSRRPSAGRSVAARRRRHVSGAALQEVDRGVYERTPRGRDRLCRRRQRRGHRALPRAHVDFGASDAALTDEQIASLRSGCEADPGHRRHGRARLQPARTQRAAEAEPRRLHRHLRREDPRSGTIRVSGRSIPA